MQMLFIGLKQHVARKWIILSSVLGALFLMGTIIYVAGVLFLPTLLVERWLLLRPETGFDCVLVEWRNLGEVPATLILTGLLGIVCLLTGYRRRVLPLLLLLLLLSVGIEGVCKLSIGAPLSPTLRSAMTDLSCPQFAGKSQLFKLEVGLGMVSKVPAQSPGMIRWSHTVAAMPIDLTASEREYSYPSGHAARWCFIWFLAAWLVQRHSRPRLLGRLLAVLLFMFAFMGGFIQFYTAVHFISDVLAGYLLGGALACAAMAILLFNGPGERVARSINVIVDHDDLRTTACKSEGHIMSSTLLTIALTMQAIAIGALVSKATLEKLNEKYDKIFDALIAHDRLTNERLGDIQNQIIEQDNKLDGKIAGLQTEMRQRFTQVETTQIELDGKIVGLQTEMRQRFSETAAKEDIAAMENRILQAITKTQRPQSE